MRKVRALFEVVKSAIASMLEPRRPYTKQSGAGAQRAAERLSVIRQKQSGVDLTPIPSRQQARQNARVEAKRVLSIRKADAMRAKQPGGSASVR